MVRHQDVITSQTKTRDRVRDLAEVYTHKREVDAMLDLVGDMFPSKEHPRNITRTFLEPSCGSGNFLIAILERKLAYVTTDLYRSQATFEVALLKAISSIYGIDIDQSNVEASRNFLRAEIAHHANLELNTVPLTEDFWAAADTILTANVIRANALTDAHAIRFIDWHWERQAGFVRRTWSQMVEREEQMDLFGSNEADAPTADLVALHYSELPNHPEPFLGGNRKRYGGLK